MLRRPFQFKLLSSSNALITFYNYMQNHFLLVRLREWWHFVTSSFPVLNVQQKLFSLNKRHTFKLLTRKLKLYLDFSIDFSLCTRSINWEPCWSWGQNYRPWLKHHSLRKSHSALKSAADDCWWLLIVEEAGAEMCRNWEALALVKTWEPMARSISDSPQSFCLWNSSLHA